MTEQIIVTERRGEEYTPDDGFPQCNYCNSMRFVIDLDGNLKPCPTCGVAQGWRSKSFDKYSSAHGKSKAQTFETFQPITPALKAIKTAFQEYARNPKGWLLIYGMAGNGKTHLCSAAHNEIGKHSDCLYVSMPDLIASLKSLFDDATRTQEHQTYQERLHLFQSCEVLILDDLGSERQTDWTNGVLFELLDYRYRNQLATILSTNLDPNDRNIFDARLISRWNDTQFSAVYRNTAPDYRRRNGTS